MLNDRITAREDLLRNCISLILGVWASSGTTNYIGHLITGLNDYVFAGILIVTWLMATGFFMLLINGAIFFSWEALKHRK